METFRDVTMRRLVTTLKKARVEERLGVTLKDPREFDVEYILGIVGKLKDAKDAPNTRSCKNFIRSCYRKVEDNRGVIGEILDMVPSDIYGSVLSGGFSLILTASILYAPHKEMKADLCQLTRLLSIMLNSEKPCEVSWQRYPRSWRLYKGLHPYTTARSACMLVWMPSWPPSLRY